MDKRPMNVFVYLIFLFFLGINSWVSAQAFQDIVRSPFNPSNTATSNKAKFAITDFYYRDDEGKKVPLVLYLKAFAVRLRPGVKPESFMSLYKEDSRVAGITDRSDLNLLIVQVKKEIQSDQNLLDILNEFNTSSSMVQFATPIVQTQGKTLVLTDEFTARFKSFVTPEEINEFNKKHQLERLSVEKENNKYQLFVLQLTPASDKNILQMVHTYEESDLVKNARPRFLSLPKPLVVKTYLTPSVVNPGDPVLYRLQIIRDENVQIEESLLSPGSINLKPAHLDAKAFKILDDPSNPFPGSTGMVHLTPSESRTEDNQILTTRNYRLVFYATGEYEIPSVNILYTIKKEGSDQGPGETQELQTDPMPVKVVSLLPANMKDINGIPLEGSLTNLPEMSKFSAYRTLLLGFILLIFSLIGLFLLIYTWTRQSKKQSLKEVSGKEKAISELKKLEEYLQGEASQPVSSILYEQIPRSFRKALGLFYGFPAESGSTSKVLKQLESLKAEAVVYKATQLILQEYGDKRFLPKDLRPVPVQQEVEKILSTVREVEQHFENCL
jgi:hypothetical protein